MWAVLTGICPHFCPCMEGYAIRHTDRLTNTTCLLAVAAFAVYVQKCVHPLVSKAHSVCPHFLSVHGSLLTRKMRRRKDLCRRRKKEKENKKKVRHGGLEPPTTWLKVKCSTIWANVPGNWASWNRTNDTAVKVLCLNRLAIALCSSKFLFPCPCYIVYYTHLKTIVKNYF